MKQTLDPIQHILDKLSYEDQVDIVDFFNDRNKVGTVDVFDEIYPEKETTQKNKDIMDMFGYKPVSKPE